MNASTFPISVRFYKNAVSLSQETKVSEYKFVCYKLANSEWYVLTPFKTRDECLFFLNRKKE